ncbi:MAG: (2Fe-2S) ferredoxin domain-containing protein [Cyanobacteria bacterium P01_C01_bin.72]
MVTVQPLVSEFTIVGRLEDLLLSSQGRIKYLSLTTPEADYVISVAKEQGESSMYLQPGCYLKVTGMRKYKLHQSEIKYKAYRIEVLPDTFLADDALTKSRPARAKILVCQGSSCGSKGGKTVCQLLAQELADQDLAEKIEIKVTGCMKRCKQAPYLVMPGRKAYGKVQPQQVSGLIQSHLRKYSALP